MTRLKTINFTEGFRSAFINTVLVNLHNNPIKIRPKRKKRKEPASFTKIVCRQNRTGPYILVPLTFWPDENFNYLFVA